MLPASVLHVGGGCTLFWHAWLNCIQQCRLLYSTMLQVTASEDDLQDAGEPLCSALSTLASQYASQVDTTHELCADCCSRRQILRHFSALGQQAFAQYQ